MSNSVAVIILTFNEEANLPAALASVKGWADEVFVVDSYSTDRTVEIALANADDGVQVVQHAFRDYSDQWNWSLTHLPIKASWTLKLDADEQVTAEFREEIDRLIEGSDEKLEGVLFRRKLFFLGRPVTHGGTQSNYDLRFWRTGKARFEDRAVNEHALVEGETKQVSSMIDHHDFKTLTDWIDKHNRYSSLEAISIGDGNVTGEVMPRLFGSPIERRIWLRRAYQKMPLRHLVLFLHHYVGTLGFLDGRAGFQWAFFRMVYFYWIDLKVNEYRRTGKRPPVIFPPRGKPHPVVESSPLQQQVDRKALAAAA